MHNTTRADYAGSFIIHHFAKGPRMSDPLEFCNIFIFRRLNV